MNRRAQERNGLAPEKADRSQLVDFAYYLDRQKQKGGHASQLYSRETALALLELTTNFTRAWTKQSAIDTLNLAFDWVETRLRWWVHQRARPEMDAALAGFERFIATTEVSKHRVIVTAPQNFRPHCKIIYSTLLHVTWSAPQKQRWHVCWQQVRHKGNEPLYFAIYA